MTIHIKHSNGSAGDTFDDDEFGAALDCVRDTYGEDTVIYACDAWPVESLAQLRAGDALVWRSDVDAHDDGARAVASIYWTRD